MPGLAMEAMNRDGFSGEHGPQKESLTQQGSPRSPLSPQSPESDSIDLAIDGVIDTSIEQLYNNVCEMQSSDHSSRTSFRSYGEESRIDSELRHLVGDIGEFELTKEVVVVAVAENESKNNENDKNEEDNVGEVNNPRTKSPTNKKHAKSTRKPSSVPKNRQRRSPQLVGIEPEPEPGNSDLGPFLLKQAREMISSGENPRRALEVATRAAKSFEDCPGERPNLDQVMCLHVLATLQCSLGRFEDAIPTLERSIEIPAIEDGPDHALAKFAGCMQLGDTYAMMGQIENSLLLYMAGSEIQRQVLGEKDPRFGETCRYIAEAHVQALQFDEAERLCRLALEIHRESGSRASPEEAADRRLMGLICESKGDYEPALEHYVIASMSMASNGHDLDVASIDCSIGDAYLSLARYDEAVFAYQKALAVFRSSKGESHPAAASVLVRLADLHHKVGKFRESRSYCESALKIYSKPSRGIGPEEIASGLVELSAIYQSMDEPDRALKLLKKASRLFGDAPRQQNTVAGIEAQIGVMYYMTGDFSESYEAFRSAVSKFRAGSEKKSALFGIALNQMGLACVQLCSINEAAELFEEAKSVLEKEYGPFHPETLGVCSNLAGTYDAMGRIDDAIEILEYVVGMREEKLGTANPEVDDEKRRLTELLREAGRARNRKARTLETLLDTNNAHVAKDDCIEVM